jgi:hypothetical protein
VHFAGAGAAAALRGRREEEARREAATRPPSVKNEIVFKPIHQDVYAQVTTPRWWPPLRPFQAVAVYRGAKATRIVALRACSQPWRSGYDSFRILKP